MGGIKERGKGRKEREARREGEEGRGIYLCFSPHRRPQRAAPPGSRSGESRGEAGGAGGGMDGMEGWDGGMEGWMGWRQPRHSWAPPNS